MTCFRWDISKVGYGITDEHSVIELFTKIKIQTIGRKFHRIEMQSYDPEINSYMTQLIQIYSVHIFILNLFNIDTNSLLKIFIN